MTNAEIVRKKISKCAKDINFEIVHLLRHIDSHNKYQSHDNPIDLDDRTVYYAKTIEGTTDKLLSEIKGTIKTYRVYELQAEKIKQWAKQRVTK